ncbi:hypothetical protein ABFG93_05405 [Pseudalkalibacillus hwajinpoensis]|uniref:hypothetical protein n=1 Tax=Guptibacillus hwajinpoensis TaxID=208199 RepID=UPI00325B4EE1
MGKIKEPIKKKWIWVLLVLLMLAIVPWYFPGKAVHPIIFGFPFWAFISLIFSLVLSGYLSWLCMHEWNVVEEIEESEKRKESAK